MKGITEKENLDNRTNKFIFFNLSFEQLLKLSRQFFGKLKDKGYYDYEVNIHHYQNTGKVSMIIFIKDAVTTDYYFSYTFRNEK